MYNNITIFPPQYPGKDTVYTLNKNTSVQPAPVDFVKLPNGYYASLDPRTYNSPHNQRLEFDRPPLVSMGTIPQGNVYNNDGNSTGYYKDYESIKGGNVKYYTDLKIDMPGRNASNISIPIYTVPEIMVDPMGAIKPYYQRIPINNKKNAVYDYSFLSDSAEFREDITWLRNQKPRVRSGNLYRFFNEREKYYPMYKYPVDGHFPWTSHGNLENKDC
jgi:hypothetical protein